MGFKIIRGDITKIECDAIVNSVGLETPDYGRICNDVIENSKSVELKEFIDGLDGDASVGDVFVTKGYALPAKNIVHLICPHFASDPDLTVFQSVVRKVLLTCKEKGFRNIGIPVFGTGANGYNRPDVYNLLTFMCSSFVEYYPEFNITLVTVSKSVQAKHKKMAKYATDAFRHKTDMEITHYCMTVRTFKKNTNVYKTIDVYEDPKGFFGGEFEKTAQVALLPQDDPNRPTITLDDKTMLKIDNVKEYMEVYADRRFPNQFSNADKILIRAKRYLGLSSKDDDVAKSMTAASKLLSSYKVGGRRPKPESMFKLALGLRMNYSEAQNFMNFFGLSFTHHPEKNTLESGVRYCLDNHLYEIEEIEDEIYKRTKKTFFYSK